MVIQTQTRQFLKMVNSKRFFHFVSPTKKKHYLARRLVGFTSDEMYSVVSDIKNYKRFVPFCKKSTILTEKPGYIEANLQVGFPPISENYTSKVTLVEPKLVQAICNDGRVFSYLETTWKFSPGLKSNDRTCVVEFNINFEFRSVLYTHLATLFFDSLISQMENAFIEEAVRRYGRETVPTHVLTVVKRN